MSFGSRSVRVIKMWVEDFVSCCSVPPFLASSKTRNEQQHEKALAKNGCCGLRV